MGRLHFQGWFLGRTIFSPFQMAPVPAAKKCKYVSETFLLGWIVGLRECQCLHVWAVLRWRSGEERRLRIRVPGLLPGSVSVSLYALRLVIGPLRPQFLHLYYQKYIHIHTHIYIFFTHIFLKDILRCTLLNYWKLRTSFSREFPGGPVVRTPRFHCRGCRFNPWLGN